MSSRGAITFEELDALVGRLRATEALVLSRAKSDTSRAASLTCRRRSGPSWTTSGSPAIHRPAPTWWFGRPTVWKVST
jgi:hypothetical protein